MLGCKVMSREVKNMFASIAHRYDKANDVLSLGVHRCWRKSAARFADFPRGASLLDICCGTGALSRELADWVGPNGKITAVDFVSEMLEIATKERSADGSAPIQFINADAMQLPFADASFDGAAVAFGIRNVDDVPACLKELHRVLRPGGRLMILEFGKPNLPIFSQAFILYSRWIMPQIGRLLTGNKAAYEYLPRTAQEFPCRQAFCEIMTKSGFVECEFKSLTAGIAYVYRGLSNPSAA